MSSQERSTNDRSSLACRTTRQLDRGVQAMILAYRISVVLLLTAILIAVLVGVHDLKRLLEIVDAIRSLVPMG